MAEIYLAVAEQGGENSLFGGTPPQPKSVAEKYRRGGKISPWRKIAVAEKIAMAEKNRFGFFVKF
jgi:hypothetical protein